MGRVTWSRREALLRFPASDGEDTMWQWLDRFAGAMRFSDGARLSDTWLGSNGSVVALIDAPQTEDFDWVVDETAKELSLPREDIELTDLSGTRERFAFMGDPAAPNPGLRNPHPQQWERIDIGPDDRTLRVEYMHGVVTELHSVVVTEDEYRVNVTVFLGWDLPEEVEKGERAYVLVGITGWTSVLTQEPVGRREVVDFAGR
jgi:hypothetical protein